MESLLYWIWIVAEILLFLFSLRLGIWLIFLGVGKLFDVTVSVSGFGLFGIAKIRLTTSKIDIEVTDVGLTLIKATSGFIGVHIKCIKVQADSHSSSSNGSTSRRTGGKWHLLPLKILSKVVLKVFQLSVSQLDVGVHHTISPTLGYLDLVCINDGAIVKKGSTSQSSQVLLDIKKLAYNSWICFDNETNSSHRLIEVKTALNSSFLMGRTGGRLLESVQFGISSLDVQIEAVSVSQLVKRLKPKDSKPSSTASSLKLPKKLEVLVNTSSLKCLSSTDNRYLEVRAGMSSFNFANEDEAVSDVSLNVKKLFVQPSQCPSVLQLKQIHTNVKLKDNSANVSVNMMSVKSYVNDDLSNWIHQFSSLVHHPTEGNVDEKPSYRQLPPVAIVMSADVSDCCVSVAVGSPADPPLCQLVLASGTMRAKLLPADNGAVRPASVSFRLVNSYVYAPLSEVRDNPSILPVSEIHQRGRVLSVGSSTFSVSTPDLSDLKSTLKVEVKGQSWILDLSDKMVTILTRLLKSFRQQSSSTKAPSMSVELPSLDVESNLNGLNVFISDNDSLSIMGRADSICLTSPSYSEATLTVYRVAVDQVRVTDAIQCMPVADLPTGLLAYCQQLAVTRNHSVLSVNVSKSVVEWTPGVHVSLLKTTKLLTSQINTLKKSFVKGTAEDNQTVQEFSKQSDVLTFLLQKIPIIVNVEAEELKCNLSLDRRRNKEVCLSLLTSHFSIKEGRAVSLDVYQAKVVVDNRQLISVEGLRGAYPHSATRERSKCPAIDSRDNGAFFLALLRIEVYLEDNYRFYETYEKLMNVRKFVAGGISSKEQRQLLPMDLIIEIDELMFQIEDNPLEVRLWANYELMCDEAEQRELRQSALNEKLEGIKKDQGRLFSVKLSQNLKESLNCSNAEIFCQRAKEMYCNEPLPTELFSVNISQLRVAVMSDYSLQGTDKLVHQMKTMDSVSPINEDCSFSTLWGVYIDASANHVETLIRDYPWKLIEGKSFDVNGKIVFAEQEISHDRETYQCSIDVGPVWTDSPVVTRKLPPLKYYHDLTISSEGLEISWGPCLDPAFAQINYAFSLITKPSLDPSPPLPWWDKCRLLVHGRAVLQTQTLSVNLLSSTNPYVDSEFLNVRLINLGANLTDNVCVSLNGSLEVYVYTATRYNECRIVQIPSVSADIQYSFDCQGDSHGHHFVTRCMNNKLPVSAEGQEHDSYKLFRSQTMDIDAILVMEKTESSPSILLYASTLRWLQKWLDVTRSNISRPIRRGKVHNNVRPKKKRFTRQLRNISLSLKLPDTAIQYWSSVAKAQGISVDMKHCEFDVKQYLKLVPYKDGLIRRLQPVWTITSCTGSIYDLAVFTCTSGQGLSSGVSDDESVVLQNIGVTEQSFEKRIFVLLSELKYVREGAADDKPMDFKHQLKTVDCKMVWSEFNRNVVYKLLNSYNLYKRLKRDLSSDALRSVFNNMANSDESVEEDGEDSETGPKKPLTRHNSGCIMLDQLLSDICNTLVTSEESREPSDPKLKGIVAANGEDVKQHDWFIELHHTQIALQGLEKKGFVICSSYIAQVFGREHHPQLRGGDLVTKNSWVAKVQDLQYFCSVDSDSNYQYVPWLPMSTVQPPGSNRGACPDPESLTSMLLSQLGPDLAHPIGAQEMMSSRPPGEAVGGLVTSIPLRGVVFDESQLPSTEGKPVSIQRIASRCHCQIFYVSYGDVVSSDEVVPPSSSTGSTDKARTAGDAVDTFTFRYPSAEVATTSFQYSLILDIVNNLLLYKEPRKKETTEQHARLKFMLQLSSLTEEGFRKPILAKQNKIRQILARLRVIENNLYIESRGDRGSAEVQSLEKELLFGKEELFQSSVELRAMIRAFKERQLLHSLPPARSDSEGVSAEATRRIEVWMDDAQWFLMHNDGQLQVSEIRLTNFSYNRILFSDDSGEHRFELGSFRVKNCMPNTPSAYQEVLSPYDPASRRLRVDKNVSLRIYCRDQSPVAGISVTEHLELNVVPLSVKLTERFYSTLQEYFLPKAEAESRELSSDPLPPEHSHVLGVQPTYIGGEAVDITDGGVHSKGTKNQSTPNSPLVKEERRRKFAPEKVDDVEIMKTRASKVKTFIYVKFPQTSLCITYKGEGITVKEINDRIVTIPTLEYHNLNLSWRALLLEVKKDYKNAIIAQVLKSVIGLKETDEKAGLASPKLGRSTSDILLGRVKEGKAKTKKAFTRHSADVTTAGVIHEAESVYTPPTLIGDDRQKIKLHPLQSSKK